MSWLRLFPSTATRSGCSSARRRRARGRRAAYGRLRPDLPPGRSVRRMAEFAAAAMAKSGQDGTAGQPPRVRGPVRGRLDAGRRRADPALPDPPRCHAVHRADGDLTDRGPLAAGLRHDQRWRAGPGLWWRCRALAPVPAGLPSHRHRLRHHRPAVPRGHRGAGHHPGRQALAGGGGHPAGLRAAGRAHRLLRRPADHPVRACPGLGGGVLRAAPGGDGLGRRGPDRHRCGVRAAPTRRAGGRADVHPAAETGPPGGLGHRPGRRGLRGLCPADLDHHRGGGVLAGPPCWPAGALACCSTWPSRCSSRRSC